VIRFPVPGLRRDKFHSIGMTNVTHAIFSMMQQWVLELSTAIRKAHSG